MKTDATDGVPTVTKRTPYSNLPAVTRARTRSPDTEAANDASVPLWQRTLSLLWPWSRQEYRGFSVHAAEALRYAPGTVRRWRFPHGPGVSSDAAARIAAHLEHHATMAATLAAEWRRYEAERAAIEAARVPFFRKRAAGWRSTPL